jgi:hypothetical protein
MGGQEVADLCPGTVPEGDSTVPTSPTKMEGQVEQEGETTDTADAGPDPDRVAE